MANRDYTKFSNVLQDVVSEENIQNGVTVNLTDELETEAEIETILDVIENAPEAVVKTDVVGVVTDCVKLNIRKTPNPNGEVIGTIDANSEVIVDEDESTSNFYKICTAAGTEGFCMKKFIRIK